MGLISTLMRYLPRMLQYPNVGLLLGPYSNVLSKLDVKEKFIRNWSWSNLSESASYLLNLPTI